MYMNKLFPLPLYTFLKITSANGGVSFNKLKNITPWLIKTILFEPARWAELALYNQKISQHSITTDPVFILGEFMKSPSSCPNFTNEELIFLGRDGTKAKSTETSNMLDALFKIIRTEKREIDYSLSTKKPV